MKYRPDIDGLRAVAVLAVVFFHGGAKKLFSGGYVGVDVFFIISGYVIALTLYDDLKRGRFSIWRFYGKRVRRIFPALFVVICVSLCAGWFLLLPSFYSDFFNSVWATATFVSNIYFWKNSGYFAATAISTPLLHTWSLAIEEQYYVVAPFLFFIVYKYFRSRWALFFVPIIVLSLAISCYATIVAPTANFFLLPTRFWELLLGALLALSPPRPVARHAVNEGLAFLGMGLIVYAIFTFSDQTAFPGYNALFPCVGAALLIYADTQKLTYMGKFLAARPTVGIGKISYSLYLIHWPIIVFFYFITLREPGYRNVGPIVLLSLLLAFLSWKYVEQPFRHLEGKVMQRRLLMGGAATIVVFFVIGLVGAHFDGFPSRFPNFTTQKIESRELWKDNVCFLEAGADPKTWDYERCKIISNGDQRVMLWGDSFAAQYVPGIEQNAANIPYTIVQYTAAGCPPIVSYRSYARPWCTDFNAHALDVIRKNKIGTVILSGLWTDMESRGLDQIQSTLKELDQLGVKTFVIGQSPEFSIDVQVLGYHEAQRSNDTTNKWNVFFDPAMNDVLRNAVGDHAFIDPMKHLCEGAECVFRDHGTYLFADYGHFSSDGSKRAVESYFPLFER